MSSENHPKNRYLRKRIINESSKATLKRRLRETSWDAVKGLDNPNKSYVAFIETITQIYDDCFPKTKFKIKSNNKANPWITKGIPKSSKRKKKLYEKFLRNRSIQNEKIYEDNRKLFETITMNGININGNAIAAISRCRQKDMANYERSDRKIQTYLLNLTAQNFH